MIVKNIKDTAAYFAFKMKVRCSVSVVSEFVIFNFDGLNQFFFFKEFKRVVYRSF